MTRKLDMRIVALIILVVVSYGIGFFRGRERLGLVLEAAHVAADMSGSWERRTDGTVHVLIRHYEGHIWYVLVGAYADPRNTVQTQLGAGVARQIPGHGDERDWVLYTVLADGTVLPAVDVSMKSDEQGSILRPHGVVVVKNTGGSGHVLLQILPAQSANRGTDTTFHRRLLAMPSNIEMEPTLPTVRAMMSRRSAAHFGR